MHLSSKMAKSEPLGYLGFTLFFFLVGAFLGNGISPTLWLREKMVSVEKNMMRSEVNRASQHIR